MLREAGVLPPASKKARRKSHSKKGKHILFAEDDAEGSFAADLSSAVGRITDVFTTARQRASTSRQSAQSQEDSHMDVEQAVEVDMGWKRPEETKRKRRKSKGAAEDEAGLDDSSSLQTSEAKKVGYASSMWECTRC